MNHSPLRRGQGHKVLPEIGDGEAARQRGGWWRERAGEFRWHQRWPLSKDQDSGNLRLGQGRRSGRCYPRARCASHHGVSRFDREIEGEKEKRREKERDREPRPLLFSTPSSLVVDSEVELLALTCLSRSKKSFFHRTAFSLSTPEKTLEACRA